LLDVTSDEASVKNAMNRGYFGAIGTGADFVASVPAGMQPADAFEVFDKAVGVTVTIEQTFPGVENYFIPPNGSTYEWIDLTTGQNILYVYDADSGGSWFQPTQYDYDWDGQAEVRRSLVPTRVYHASGGGSTGPIVTQGSGTLTYDPTWEGPTDVKWMGSYDGNTLNGVFQFSSGTPFNFTDPTAGEVGQSIIVDVSSWKEHFLPPVPETGMTFQGTVWPEGTPGPMAGHAVGTLGGIAFLGSLRIWGDTKLVICGNDGVPVTTSLTVGDQLWLSGVALQ